VNGGSSPGWRRRAGVDRDRRRLGGGRRERVRVVPEERSGRAVNGGEATAHSDSPVVEELANVRRPRRGRKFRPAARRGRPRRGGGAQGQVAQDGMPGPSFSTSRFERASDVLASAPRTTDRRPSVSSWTPKRGRAAASRVLILEAWSRTALGMSLQGRGPGAARGRDHRARAAEPTIRGPMAKAREIEGFAEAGVRSRSGRACRRGAPRRAVLVRRGKVLDTSDIERVHAMRCGQEGALRAAIEILRRCFPEGAAHRSVLARRRTAKDLADAMRRRRDPRPCRSGQSSTVIAVAR